MEKNYLKNCYINQMAAVENFNKNENKMYLLAVGPFFLSLGHYISYTSSICVVCVCERILSQY